MEWQSFFIGMGAMFGLILVVFFLVPGRKNKEAETDMAVLHGFWRYNIRISLENQESFESIAESLRKSCKDYYEPINIIFDGPRSTDNKIYESGRFVGVEKDNGESINYEDSEVTAGEWLERDISGLWALRITELPKKEKP